jgi:hypothetical protein
MKLLIMKFSPLPCYLVPLRPQIFSSTPSELAPHEGKTEVRGKAIKDIIQVKDAILQI